MYSTAAQMQLECNCSQGVTICPDLPVTHYT